MANLYGGVEDTDEGYVQMATDGIAKIKQRQEYEMKKVGGSAEQKSATDEADVAAQAADSGRGRRKRMTIIVLGVTVIGLLLALIALCVALSVTTTQLQDDVTALQSRLEGLEDSDGGLSLLLTDDQNETEVLEILQELNASVEFVHGLLKQQVVNLSAYVSSVDDQTQELNVSHEILYSNLSLAAELSSNQSQALMESVSDFSALESSLSAVNDAAMQFNSTYQSFSAVTSSAIDQVSADSSSSLMAHKTNVNAQFESAMFADEQLSLFFESAVSDARSQISQELATSEGRLSVTIGTLVFRVDELVEANSRFSSDLDNRVQEAAASIQTNLETSFSTVNDDITSLSDQVTQATASFDTMLDALAAQTANSLTSFNAARDNLFAGADRSIDALADEFQDIITDLSARYDGARSQLPPQCFCPFK